MWVTALFPEPTHIFSRKSTSLGTYNTLRLNALAKAKKALHSISHHACFDEEKNHICFQWLQVAYANRKLMHWKEPNRNQKMISRIMSVPPPSAFYVRASESRKNKPKRRPNLIDMFLHQQELCVLMHAFSNTKRCHDFLRVLLCSIRRGKETL